MATTPILPSLRDPLLIRIYAEALAKRQQWQDTIQQTLRMVLGLENAEPFVPESILSAAEIRRQMSDRIPFSKKLSDLIIAMREE